MDGSQQQRVLVATSVVGYDLDRRAITRVRPFALDGARLTVLASFLTIFAPFLFARIPPLVDYANHLARFWLLAGGARDPALAPFYGIHWSNASTNIGVDLAASFLSSVAPASLVAHVAALTAAALPPLGALALNVCVFRRLTPWQAMFPIAVWSTTFLMGFLNFQIGIGLALVFAAADPWLQRRLGRCGALARVPIAMILAVDHLYALLFYAVLIAGLAFGPAPLAWRRWRETADRLRQAAFAAVWCLIPLLPLALFAPALPGADAQAAALAYGSLFYRLDALLTPLSAYNVVVAALFTLAVAGLVIWLARRRALKAHAGLLLAGVGLIVVTLLVPDQASGGSWISRRVPTMALLTILAALQIRQRSEARFGLGLGLAALAVVAAQAVWVSWAWRAMDANLSAVRRVLAGVPAGATVLPLQHEPTLAMRWSAPVGRYVSGLGDPTFRHYAALATPLRHAFVPTLFSARGLQPLQVRGDWNRFVEHNGGELASVSALARERRPGDPAYLDRWSARFDYILVLNADMPDARGPFIPPPGVTLVSDAGFAQLWRIDHKATVS